MALKLFAAVFPSYVALIVVLQNVDFAASASLYNPDDPLWELDSANFKRVVFDKNNAWFIEFYNSWCGHCIRFAPTWKSFARDIENWKNVIDIGVVNCVDPENVELCRNYGVEGFPTLKLYGAQINETEKGLELRGKRSWDNLFSEAITFLEAQEPIPQNWPNLRPIQATALQSLWSELPANINSVYLVIEEPESLTGRKTILDLSTKRDIVMRRVLSSNTQLVKNLINELPDASVPVYLKVYKNGQKESVSRFDSSANETYIRDTIFETLVGGQRVKDDNTIVTDEPTDNITAPKGVFMADLENALHYSLRQEIGVHKDINSAKLYALKNYIATLRTYFPGRPSVMAYLTKLHNWIINRKANMTGERFVTALDNLQTEKENLPPMQEWVGCRGSTPKYRGYPCSLWTLFHTLTVQIYNQHEDSPNYNKDPQKILYTIRDYVKYFFTCQDCAEHFLFMSQNLDKEAVLPKDSVLWLWQAHNQVNKRLAGDATEDPANPKRQFPVKEACRQCRIPNDPKYLHNDEINWDKNAVLRYLQYYYKRDRIQYVDPRRSSNVQQSNKSVAVGQSHEEENTTDGVAHAYSSDYPIVLALLSSIGWYQGI